MSTVAWCWLAPFGGFLLGFFIAVVLTRDRDDEEELERMFKR